MTANDYVVSVAQRIREEMRKGENYIRPESGVVRFTITIADLNALLSNVFYIEPWQSDDLHGFGNEATSSPAPTAHAEAPPSLDEALVEMEKAGWPCRLAEAPAMIRRLEAENAVLRAALLSLERPEPPVKDMGESTEHGDRICPDCNQQVPRRHRCAAERPEPQEPHAGVMSALQRAKDLTLEIHTSPKGLADPDAAVKLAKALTELHDAIVQAPRVATREDVKNVYAEGLQVGMKLGARNGSDYTKLVARLNDYRHQVLQGFTHISREEADDLIFEAMNALETQA